MELLYGFLFYFRGGNINNSKKQLQFYVWRVCDNIADGVVIRPLITLKKGGPMYDVVRFCMSYATHKDLLIFLSDVGIYRRICRWLFCLKTKIRQI